MNMAQPAVMSIGADRTDGLAKLIKMSHNDPMDFANALPWEIGVQPMALPKIAEHSWLYGTACYESLSESQRRELLWLEVARDVSLFIHLEQILPLLYMNYVYRHPHELTPAMSEYLMIFSKEEIVHTMVFKRYMEMAKLPIFWDHTVPHEALTGLSKLSPAGGVIYTLIVEWVAELGAMYSTQNEEIDPLTREMFRRHHVDESRHLAFGRWVAEDFLSNAPGPAVQGVRDMVKGMMAKLIPLYTFDPLISKYTSFEYPVVPENSDAVAQVRNSASNKMLNERRFAPLFTWLKKWDLM